MPIRNEWVQLGGNRPQSWRKRDRWILGERFMSLETPVRHPHNSDVFLVRRDLTFWQRWRGGRSRSSDPWPRNRFRCSDGLTLLTSLHDVIIERHTSYVPSHSPAFSSFFSPFLFAWSNTSTTPPTLHPMSRLFRGLNFLKPDFEPVNPTLAKPSLVFFSEIFLEEGKWQLYTLSNLL